MWKVSAVCCLPLRRIMHDVKTKRKKVLKLPMNLIIQSQSGLIELLLIHNNSNVCGKDERKYLLTKLRGIFKRKTICEGEKLFFSFLFWCFRSKSKLELVSFFFSEPLQATQLSDKTLKEFDLLYCTANYQDPNIDRHLTSKSIFFGNHVMKCEISDHLTKILRWYSNEPDYEMLHCQSGQDNECLSSKTDILSGSRMSLISKQKLENWKKL